MDFVYSGIDKKIQSKRLTFDRSHGKFLSPFLGANPELVLLMFECEPHLAPMFI